VAYEAGEYWNRLHEAGHDEAVVGYPELPVSLNRAMYDTLRASARRLLAAHGLLGAPGRVLDVGAGTGIWTDFWLRAGAQEVVGIDLAGESVRLLRERLPRARFAQADISAQAVPVEGPFDVVSAMSVLLHIKDDAAWRRAVANIAALLRPGGHAVITDAVLVHTWWGEPFDESNNSLLRPLEAWKDAFAAAGLELVDLRPATVVLSNVSDTRSRYAFAALWRFWGLLQQATRGRERAGAVAGTVLKAIDRPLCALLPHGPSAKLMLVRRPPA
jgi:SAM-dependent methyltransferase